jgi:DNA modification methylase
MKDKRIIDTPIADLKPAAYNPRIWSEKATNNLKQSLEVFGMVDPIVANSYPKRKNVVIGGHFRLHAAQLLGWKTVPVAYVSITDLEKEKELNIRLNKNTGDWDLGMLAAFDEKLLKTIGFESVDLDKIFAQNEPDDEFDAEEYAASIKKPESEPGKVYGLGQHRIMCGDATNPADYAKLMGNDLASMCFCDPPYNVDYQEGMGTHEQNKREGIMNDKMDSNDFRQFLTKAMSNIVGKTEGAIYVCMSASELHNLKPAFEAAGGHFQIFLIWVKNTFTLSRSDWQNQYEPILYGWRDTIKNHYFAGWRDEGNVWEDLHEIRPRMTDNGGMEIELGEYHIQLEKWSAGTVIRKKDGTDIWREKKPSKSKLHPTMKPINLVAKAIKASSTRGQIVLDPFGGSGSTLIAAEQTGRRCYMMELDPVYCDVIRKRYRQFMENKKKS